MLEVVKLRLLEKVSVDKILDGCFPLFGLTYFLHFMAWDGPSVIQGLQLLKEEENRSLDEETIDNASIPGG